jgi:chemotaxis protein methyltransferase CheR/two-component system CheB/CheR fusion protein
MMHVAGIGASAGGLEAMLQLFAHMQATGRVSYVVAQHMAKDGHDELVVRLMQRESVLPVLLATDGIHLQADTVYVIPSGQDGQVRSGGSADVPVLALSPPHASHVSTPSANALMRSIATVCGSSAIGIVLSGTGTDGAQGCAAIHAAGGLTLVQDPAQAKFNGMPQSAIDTRLVDQVLPAERMGEVLATRFPGKPAPGWAPGVGAASITPAVTALPSSAAPKGESLPDPALQELQQLLRQVQTATGIDFSSYKEDTLLRRLVKRKEVVGADSAQAYQALIRRDATELHTLQHLFLVSVSSFFRDRASFDALQKELATLVATKPVHTPIRVWVPGCASGEEAFTLAMVLKELTRSHPIEIVASDLNPDALALCHEGVYRPVAFKEMDAALRDRYFEAQGPQFAIKPEIKACVQFERRDVLGGTPPTNLDLVSCRNLLIYMKTALQDQLIQSFHQALRAQGLLFIGQSESLSFVGNSLFAPIDHYHRLFRRRH